MCSAAHSKNPMRSSTSEMTITATNVIVAFQTIPHTVATFARCTTPSARATAAPPAADQPMESPFGWAMTRVKVATKTATATTVRLAPLSVSTGACRSCVFGGRRSRDL